MLKRRKLKRSVKIILIKLAIYSFLSLGLYQYYDLLFKNGQIAAVICLMTIGAAILITTVGKIIKYTFDWFDKNKVVIEPLKIYLTQK